MTWSWYFGDFTQMSLLAKQQMMFFIKKCYFPSICASSQTRIEDSLFWLRQKHTILIKQKTHCFDVKAISPFIDTIHRGLQP